MKPVKHLLTSSSKLASVPELSYKKGLPNSSLIPKPKEKQSSKFVRDKPEPMVLRSPPTGESVVRYALPIPSSKTKELIAEDELLRKITKHLKSVVSTLEETYGVCNENVEKPVVKSEHEELSLSVGDDLNAFLVCGSQFATQLEGAVKEESHILESLFKWFQQQVNHMEEVSKDQSFSEAERPAPDKASLNLVQIVNFVQKLEDLKHRLKKGSKDSSKAMPSKSKESEIIPEAAQGYENVKQKIEDFIKTHSAEENLDVSTMEPQTTTYSASNRLNAMLKIFEKQSNMLERARNDKSLLENKYKQIQNDFQVLLEEKSALENELQKLKNTEKTKPVYDRKKKAMKTKKNAKENSEDSEEKKFPVKELKTDDFLTSQKTGFSLAVENQILQEQLKQALQESEKAKYQLKYFLYQGELLKSDMQAKTTMERSISKTEVNGEDSKSILLDKETRKVQIADSSVRKTSAKIQEHARISVHNGSPIETRSQKKRATSSAMSHISEILRSEDGSALVKNLNRVSVDEDLRPISPSNFHDKSFTRVLENKKIQDVLSVRATLPGNETSFISTPVVTKRKPLGSDISKADILGEKLQSKTEKQTYQEEREYQAPDKVTDENLTLENETLSDQPTQIINQDTSRMNRRQAFLITQKTDMISDENQLPEDMDLFLRSQSQTKIPEATSNETFNTQNKTLGEDTLLQPQDSKTQLQTRKQRTSNGENFTSNGENLADHGKVPDENSVLERQDSMSKTQLQVKKRTSIGERINTQDEVPDESFMLEDQDSVSKSEAQKKNQRTHQREGFITQKVEEVLYENILPEDEVPLSKSQSQSKKLRDSKTEILSNQDMKELSKGSFILEDLEVASQILRVNNEVALELPDAAENLPSKSPSINDLILQLDLNKVSEMDIEHLPDSFERHVLMGEMKVQSQSLLETDAEHLPSAIGRGTTKGEMKMQSKNYEEINVGHSTDATAHSIMKGQLKKQSVNLPEIDTEHLPLAFGRGITKGEVKTESKGHSGINVERSTDATARGIMKGQLGKQPMDLLGINVERSTDATARGIMKGQLGKQFMDLPGINVERSTDATPRGIMKGQLGKQPMDLPEIDPKQLPSAFGRGITKGNVRTLSKSHTGTNKERSTDAIVHGLKNRQLKTQSKNLPDINTEHSLGAIGRGIAKGGLKIESKSHAAPLEGIQFYKKRTSKEHSTDAIVRGIKNRQLRTQSKDLPETNDEQILDATGKGILKGEFKAQLKNNAETYKGSLADTVGTGKLISEIREQLKSHTGVNLLENRGMSIQHQEDFFTRPTAPSKLSTSINFSPFDNQGVNLLENRGKSIQHQEDFFTRPTAPSKLSTSINFSPFDNQGMNLFKNKNMSSYQDFYTRKITPIKFPTKVVNISPFDSKDRTYEYFSPHEYEPSQALERTSRDRRSIHKTIHVSSVDKKPLGHPESSILNQKNVEITTLPSVTSKAKKFISKELFRTIWNKPEALRSKFLCC